MPRAESIRTSAWLPDRELGNGTRRRLLPLRPRQRRPDQPTMDRSVFVVAPVVGVRVLVRRSLVALLGWRLVLARRHRGLRRLARRFALIIGRRRDRRRGRHVGAVGRALVRDTLRSVREHLRIERRGRLVLAPLPRHLRVPVFVLRLARRAPRLLDVLAHHRDDGVVRHATLAWTIVVQNVTKPKLALLHQRSRSYRWQGMKCERRV